MSNYNKIPSQWNLPLINSNGTNIDANYGPWDSTDEYESWIKDTLEFGDPKNEPDIIYNGTLIAVKDPDSGVITHYVREKGAWRVFGSGGDDTSWKSTQDTSITSDTKIKSDDGYITLSDIETYLEPEYAPKWTDASLTMNKAEGAPGVYPSANGGMVVVGSTRPVMGADFGVSGQLCKYSSLLYYILRCY